MILNVALRLGCYMICDEKKIPRVDFFVAIKFRRISKGLDTAFSPPNVPTCECCPVQIL